MSFTELPIDVIRITWTGSGKIEPRTMELGLISFTFMLLTLFIYYLNLVTSDRLLIRIANQIHHELTEFCSHAVSVP